MSVNQDKQTKYHCPVEGCSFSEQKGKHFKRKMSIDQHYLNCHSERKFKCYNCEKSYAIDWQLKYHLKTCGIIWKCLTCDKFYKERLSLITHCTRHSHVLPDEARRRKTKSKKEENSSKDNSMSVMIFPVMMPTSQLDSLHQEPTPPPPPPPQPQRHQHRNNISSSLQQHSSSSSSSSSHHQHRQQAHQAPKQIHHQQTTSNRHQHHLPQQTSNRSQHHLAQPTSNRHQHHLPPPPVPKYQPPIPPPTVDHSHHLNQRLNLADLYRTFQMDSQMDTNMGYVKDTSAQTEVDLRHAVHHHFPPRAHIW